MEHGRHARPVAEMGNYRSPPFSRAENIEDVFVGQAMETITEYSFVKEGTGQGEALIDLRHTAMKGSVEAGNLHDPAVVRPSY